MFQVPKNSEHVGHNVWLLPVIRCVRHSFILRVETVVCLPHVLLSFKQDWYPLYGCSRHCLGMTVRTQLIQMCVIFLSSFPAFCST